MKKIVYTIAIAVLGFASCESSLEDTFDELGTPVNDFAVGENDYVLSEEDYETLLANEDGDFVQYFSSIDEAEGLIPSTLDGLYPNLVDGSLTNVTFNLLDNVFPETFISTVDDYMEVFGEDKVVLSGIDEVNELLQNEYPQADAGDYINLSYFGLGDTISYTLTDDDYGLVGNSSLNFDIRTGSDDEEISARVDKISIILLENFPDSFTGQRYSVTYNAFDGSFGDLILEIVVEFNGILYVQVESSIPQYTLNNPDDYVFIGEQLIDVYPGQADNIIDFNNFDLRTDTNDQWDDTMIAEAITVLLNEIFPDALEGDKYQVTYDTFNDGFVDGVETHFFEKNADGIYLFSEGELNDLLVVENLAFNGEDWVYPRTFTEEEYVLMGQSFPNFSDETVALNNIGVFLDSRVIEAEGSFFPVVYDLFDFDTFITSTIYTTFQFIDRQWIGKAVVTENSIQFGKENGVWVPDNTILYSLLDPVDYDTIVESELADIAEFSEPIASMMSFQNFDRQASTPQFWSDELIVQALGVFLDDFAPDANIAQKYNITFNTWNPGDGVETFNLIKTERGWVLNQ